nr:hypothetical protein [uncultured Allomuricauda sp.]
MKKLKNTLFYIALLFVGISCSSDDESNLSITANAQSFQLNGVNNCDLSGGTGSTFVMTIPYTSSDGVDIQKLQIKTKVSDGGSESKTNTQFTDNGTSIVWATCFRFGSQTWVEFEVTLEGSGNSSSNITTVRIDKPAGAN